MAYEGRNYWGGAELVMSIDGSCDKNVLLYMHMRMCFTRPCALH